MPKFSERLGGHVVADPPGRHGPPERAGARHVEHRQVALVRIVAPLDVFYDILDGPEELTDARRRHDEALPHDGGAALVHALRGLVDARVRLEAEVRRSVLEFQEVSVGPGPKLGLEPHLGVHVHSAARVKHRVAPQVDLEGERTELLERFVAPDDAFLPPEQFVERLHARRERVVVEVVERVPLGVAPVACRPRLRRRRRSHEISQVRVAAARVVNVPSARVAFDLARARGVPTRRRAAGSAARCLPAAGCRRSKRRANRAAGPGRRALGPPGPASRQPALLTSFVCLRASRTKNGFKHYCPPTPL